MNVPEPVKPRLRGVSHQWAAIVAVALGIALVITAPPGRATAACLIYAASVVAMFSTSATYHRVTWTSESTRRWMRRADHSMIFVLIAGSYTPFAVLAVRGSLATAILISVWAGALAGIILKLAWIDAPKALIAAVYVILGWVSIVTMPSLIRHVGIVPTMLVALGGVLYTAGAIVYARQRPDPFPAVFGYHEVFHVLVIVAAALQYAVIAFWVVPGA